MEQEVIYRTAEYKKYLRSLRYLGMPIFLLVVAAGNIGILSFGIYDSIEKNKDVLLISIIAGFLGIVCIGLIVFFILSIIDMFQMKVKMIIVEAIKITYSKNTKSLKYNYCNKELSIGIPSKWQMQDQLPQKAKIWATYYTNSVLRIEFLETGKVFDVNAL